MEIKKRLSSIIESPSHNTTEKLEKICHLLDQEFDYFNWTGFYFKNGDKEELVLGPYVGAVTDHTVIPFGKGNLWTSCGFKRNFCSAGCLGTR